MEIHALSRSRRFLHSGLWVGLALGLIVGCQTTEPASDVVVIDQPAAAIDEPDADFAQGDGEGQAPESIPAVRSDEGQAPESTPAVHSEDGSVTDDAAGTGATVDERQVGEELDGKSETTTSSEEVTEPAPEESAQTTHEEEEIIDDPSIGASLTILGVPRSARVRIMNIKQVYRRGMRLPPGTYEVLVDEPGYVSKRRTVKLGPKDIRMEVKLSREN